MDLKLGDTHVPEEKTMYKIFQLWQCLVSTSIYTTLSGAISLECCSLGSFSGIRVVWKSSIHSSVVVLCTHVGSTINMAPL